MHSSLGQPGRLHLFGVLLATLIVHHPRYRDEQMYTSGYPNFQTP
jgi:hypothetical protein